MASQLKLTLRNDEVELGQSQHGPRRVSSHHTATVRANIYFPTIAYWIAFGPHGPRSEPPKNEGRKVAMYTVLAVGVSLVMFATMRMFAGPSPGTMTREWQEASNEYLKVRCLLNTLRVKELKLTIQCRANKPTPSPASHPRATRARARSNRLPRELKQSVRFPLSIENWTVTARHGRMPAMYKTGTRRMEVVGGLSRWGWGQIRDAGLVYIMYNDDNGDPFSLSRTAHSSDFRYLSL